MRTISKKRKKSEPVDKSILLYKNVDPTSLGREVYADNVETPHSFYLTRQLYLAKDYQNLAEGESFFDAICDSWDETNKFKQLVVKKIYMYVETELMYYTLFMGSFEPVTKETRKELKEWLKGVNLEKEERMLTHKNNAVSDVNSAEMHGMMKKMMETSNEMFRLRQMMSNLNETINQTKLESGAQPVISRSIRTIHLKRAQPLVIEDTENTPEEETEKRVVKIESPVLEAEDLETTNPDLTDEVTESEKKSETESKKKTAQENTLTEEESTTYQTKTAGNNSSIKEKRENSIDKLNRKNFEHRHPGTILPRAESKPVEPKVVPEEEPMEEKVEVESVETVEEIPFSFDQLNFKKGKTKKQTPSNWPRFSKCMKNSKMMEAPKKIPLFSKTEMENLEDDIYLRFMTKRMRGAGHKDTKRAVNRTELLTQISQAEYLNYSWGQVLKERKEDVLICNRLSCANLVSHLDDFLKDVKKLAYKPSFFRRKVRISNEMMRKLEGYILMDEYMQKLSQLPQEHS